MLMCTHVQLAGIPEATRTRLSVSPFKSGAILRKGHAFLRRYYVKRLDSGLAAASQFTVASRDSP